MLVQVRTPAGATSICQILLYNFLAVLIKFNISNELRSLETILYHQDVDRCRHLSDMGQLKAFSTSHLLPVYRISKMLKVTITI